MSLLLFALSIIYLFCIGGLLWVTRYRRQYYTQAKGVCSALFLVAAVVAYLSGPASHPVAFFLLAGSLLLCALGDILLGVANRSAKLHMRPFLAGTVSFGGAHLLFCALFWTISGFALQDLILPLVLLVILTALDTTDKVWLKKMRPAAYVYTFLVGLMCAMAGRTALRMAAASPGGAVLLGVSAALFLASDIVLLFLYFARKRHKWFRYVNLTTYYVGIYGMALCACWL